MFQRLDPIFLSEVRISIVSYLINHKETEFSMLKNSIQVTSGNLSVQMSKLKKAGYIEVKKTFRDNYPLTQCRVTPKGEEALEQFIKDIASYRYVPEVKPGMVLEQI